MTLICCAFNVFRRVIYGMNIGTEDVDVDLGYTLGNVDQYLIQPVDADLTSS